MLFLHVEPTGQFESTAQIRPQMLFTQSSPERHCAPVVQWVEVTRQVPSTQRRPAAQEESAVHASRQAPAWQRLGEGQSESVAQPTGTHWALMHRSEGAQSDVTAQELGFCPGAQTP